MKPLRYLDAKADQFCCEELGILRCLALIVQGKDSSLPGFISVVNKYNYKSFISTLCDNDLRVHYYHSYDKKLSTHKVVMWREKSSIAIEWVVDEAFKILIKRILFNDPSLKHGDSYYSSCPTVTYYSSCPTVITNMTDFSLYIQTNEVDVPSGMPTKTKLYRFCNGISRVFCGSSFDMYQFLKKEVIDMKEYNSKRKELKEYMDSNKWFIFTQW